MREQYMQRLSRLWAQDVVSRITCSKRLQVGTPYRCGVLAIGCELGYESVVEIYGRQFASSGFKIRRSFLSCFTIQAPKTLTIFKSCATAAILDIDG